jgi:hypothetical protein
MGADVGQRLGKGPEVVIGQVGQGFDGVLTDVVEPPGSG